MGVSRVQSVKDGAVLSFEMRAWPSDPSKERLDPGHKGPCAVYAKKVSSAINDTAIGDGWFKLMDDGYDASSQEWCTDKLIANNGLLNVQLPQGLAGGSYLMRPEILALHQADKGDPQIYTGCAQIFLESSGNLVAESTVSIPGHMNYNEPSTDFNIYQEDASTYTLPGPKVATFKASDNVMATSSSTNQTEGLKPAGCLVENANWCGFEVSDYSDETGCWASSADCWDQSKTCYSTAPPTGQSGCDLWATKCTGIQDQCNAGNFNGPPNKGEVLTPTKETIDVGVMLGNVAKANVTSSPKSSAAQSPEAAASTSVMSMQQEAAVKPTKTAEAELPVHTITVAPSTPNAPAPTAAPQACPDGYHCVVVTNVEVVTQYVTAPFHSYKKHDGFHSRRYARHA